MIIDRRALLLSAAALAGTAAARPRAKTAPTFYTTRFVTRSGGTLKVLSSYPLNQAADRAVISVHGVSRDYTNNFAHLTEAMQMAGVNVLCISPYFPAAPEASTDLYWPDSHWSSGVNDVSKGYSSYAAIDDLIASLNVGFVTVEGHSAGGQFAHRYALATVSTKPMRFVIMNPSSYTYMNNQRPNLSGPGYIIPAVSNYDRYRYGLGSFPSSYPYVSAQGAAALRAKYLSRNVALLLGDQDTLIDSDLDTTDQANCEGVNRFDRGTRFFQHLQDFYALPLHSKFVVPGVGHDAKPMLESSAGLAATFG